MAEIEKLHQAPSTAIHHVDAAWDAVITQIRRAMALRGVHPSHTVVVVPFAQLMSQARQAWQRAQGDVECSYFLPRFETTQNWARSLGGVLPGTDDVTQDAARDVLTAASLLTRADLAEHENTLAASLMETAWSLARLAAARHPSARSAWAAALAECLVEGMATPMLALEAAVARIALAWAASSAYTSDVLFAAQPDMVVVVHGFQHDPLAQALMQRWGERALALELSPGVPPSLVERSGNSAQLHACLDAEDEAQRAAACVLVHVRAGRGPVALVAQDRVLTRRVRSLLAEQGVPLRDETGWTLSTTRAAANVMTFLRAQAWDASTDVLLDWAKNAPTFDAGLVTQAEVQWRRQGLRNWHALPKTDALRAQIKPLRDSLSAPRRLSAWLVDVRRVLQHTGQWWDLQRDLAGQALLDALRLHEGGEEEFSDVGVRMSLAAFTAWVSQTLELASYVPEHPAAATTGQVVILPLSQLLGRPVAAVVFPGCDEVRLVVSPEPPGHWTAAQRALLGLSSREDLTQALRAAWAYALRFSYLDLLWRTSDGGEYLMPSGLVQSLHLQQVGIVANDPRVLRSVALAPCVRPAPAAAALALTRMSASAYEDMRHCPYRYFALRLLKLQDSAELDTELSKRDFGNWLHLVLRHFHERLNQGETPAIAPGDIELLVMINEASEQATQELGLTHSEFLPFSSSWPRVRDGYLAWLAEHQATGARFAHAETWFEQPLGELTLVGKIDRIDHQADGRPLVLDYKTETLNVTKQRIMDGLEDTQLAFYAALLPNDLVSAAYVNVGEKDGSKTYAQDDVVNLRDQLVAGILQDTVRVRTGAPMAALGEGKACAFCAARGLCRKDFWRVEVLARTGERA